MELYIAEKPSVGRTIASVVGANERRDGYWEGNGRMVSWCIGHLVALAMPEAYRSDYQRWRYSDLPILPEKWQYTVVAETKKQFDLLRRLMNDSRVTSLVCATDAGREGELIFRLVYAGRLPEGGAPPLDFLNRRKCDSPSPLPDEAHARL